MRQNFAFVFLTCICLANITQIFGIGFSGKAHTQNSGFKHGCEFYSSNYHPKAGCAYDLAKDLERFHKEIGVVNDRNLTLIEMLKFVRILHQKETEIRGSLESLESVARAEFFHFDVNMGCILGEDDNFINKRNNDYFRNLLGSREGEYCAPISRIFKRKIFL